MYEVRLKSGLRVYYGIEGEGLILLGGSGKRKHERTMKSQDAENALLNGGAVKSDLDEELVQNAVDDPDAYRALEDGIEEARDNEEEAHCLSLLSLKAEADRRIRVRDDIRRYRDMPEQDVANKELAVGVRLSAPTSGQYQRRGLRGGRGPEATFVRGESMPPSQKPQPAGVSKRTTGAAGRTPRP